MGSRRSRPGPFDLAALLEEDSETTAPRMGFEPERSGRDFTSERSTQDDRPPSMLPEGEPTVLSPRLNEPAVTVELARDQGFEWDAAWTGTAASEADALEGQRVGEYEIGSRIASGSYSHVYRAQRRDATTPLAMKVLRGRVAEDERTRERFLREGVVLSGLRHPRLVRVTDAGVLPDGRLFHVMERVEGETLQAWLARRGRVSLEEAVWIGGQIADGLRALHAGGITHRDLKPANILVSTRGAALELKILDLGLAGWVSPEDRTRLTERGQVLGTPAYMAPELIHDPRQAGPAVDLYALGIILYELLEGHRPFAGASEVELMYAQLRREPPRAANAGPLEPLIHRLLAKDPSARPSMPEVAAWLLPGEAAALRRRPAWRWGPAAALGGAALLLATSAFLALEHRPVTTLAPRPTPSSSPPKAEPRPPSADAVIESARPTTPTAPEEAEVEDGADAPSPALVRERARSRPPMTRTTSRRDSRSLAEPAEPDEDGEEAAASTPPTTPTPEDPGARAQRVVGLLRLVATSRRDRLQHYERRYFELRRRERRGDSDQAELARGLERLERDLQAELEAAPAPEPTLP